MKNRFLLLCDFAAYHRIDVVFLFLALVGIVLVAFGFTYGWLIAIFCLTVFGCAGVFGDVSAHPTCNFHERTARDLATAFPVQSTDGEPLPPWLQAPGTGPFHINWRMGGEHYMAEFWSFFRDLHRSEQEAYFARYDLGDAWPHRAQWYRAMFDRFNLEGA